MARLEDLIAQISDQRLRREVETAVAELKRRQRFGLVFEEHIPEISSLNGLPVLPGALVQLRKDISARTLYRVATLSADNQAKIEPIDDSAAPTIVAVDDLLVVKRFGEPIYPALTALSSLQRGDADRPHHAVINGENYHALQLLLYLYEGQVDCIYVDPPYNTGARDWKYNNRYVDATDSWRHSKWLSYMEKRLRLAKRLLKPDGVMIVTIDEHEVHHLGMLLERLFPEYLRYMVTIVINPKGTAKANFSRVDEQAIFIVPDTGEDVILGRPLGQATLPLDEEESDGDESETLSENDDEDLSDEEEETEVVVTEGEWEYQHARRRGSESSYRHQRPNQFYPIYIDEENREVVRVGRSIPSDDEPDYRQVDGLRPIWPVDAEGLHRCWRFVPESMQKELDAGNLVLGKYNKKRDSWTINIRRPKKAIKKLKTVWWDTSHDAGTHGTGLVRRLLGKPGLFPFPKSVYAVRDCLAPIVRERPNALIVDFFAGSGTTFHATCLLNAEYGGQRRSILVTNNEVSDKIARKMYREGFYRGSPKFEAQGIFELVTRPRCEAVVTGRRPDGTPVPGRHIGGRQFNLGFPENIDFYRLEYLDADDVDLGHQFDAILPALWLAAGGIGAPEQGVSGEDYSIPPESTYAVLFREARFRQFRQALAQQPKITHVWLVTDSEQAFAEMRSELAANLVVSMLYRDYLRNFRINTDRTI